MAEDVFADGMPEVVGPAAQDLVDPADHGAHVGLTNTMCQGTDLRLHRPKWTVGDERVYVPLVRASLAFPLDAETQEVESVRHMHHPRLGLRQPKPQRGQCTGDVFAQGHHVVLLAVHEHDEIVRIADDPPRRQALGATVVSAGGWSQRPVLVSRGRAWLRAALTR